MTSAPNNSDMPYRDLGSTGEKVSAIGVGGWHIGLKQSRRKAQYADYSPRPSTVASHFMDNSWDYNDGASEIRMGKALKMATGTKSF